MSNTSLIIVSKMGVLEPLESLTLPTAVAMETGELRNRDLSSFMLVFGVTTSFQFPELPCEFNSIDSFAFRFSLKRHLTFDWLVGNYGRDYALLSVEQNLDMSKSKRTELVSTLSLFEWLNFPSLAKRMTQSSDRRLLQLAVQFLATPPEHLDGVVATPFSDSLLSELKNFSHPHDPIDLAADGIKTSPL